MGAISEPSGEDRRRSSTVAGQAGRAVRRTPSNRGPHRSVIQAVAMMPWNMMGHRCTAREAGGRREPVGVPQGETIQQRIAVGVLRIPGME
jgi:hypothetical protein